MREREREKGKEGEATSLQSPQRMEKPYHIPQNLLRRDGKSPQEQQHKLYHFDIKQGESREEKKKETRQQTSPLV